MGCDYSYNLLNIFPKINGCSIDGRVIHISNCDQSSCKKLKEYLEEVKKE